MEREVCMDVVTRNGMLRSGKVLPTSEHLRDTSDSPWLVFSEGAASSDNVHAVITGKY